jgi:hypothetical protein
VRETSPNDLSSSLLKYVCTLIDSREAPTHVLRRHDIVALERNPKHLGCYTETSLHPRTLQEPIHLDRRMGQNLSVSHYHTWVAASL